MRDVGFAGRELEREGLAGAGEAEESAAGRGATAPVREGERAGDGGRDGKRAAGPGEEGAPLCDLPVCCAVEIQDCEACEGGFRGDKGGYGGRRLNALVQERNAE